MNILNIRRRIYFALKLTAPVAFFCPTVALAQDRPSFESLWAEARQNPECIRADFDDFILINCAEQLTLWYFTIAAHPAVVKRELLLEDGALISRIDGNFFGPDAGPQATGQSGGQLAFQAWLAEIRDLDRQMRQTMGSAGGVQPGATPD